MRTHAVTNALQDVADWALPELLDAARLLVGELATPMADPGLVDRLPRFPRNSPLHPADEWGLYSDDVAPEDLDGMSLDEVLAQAPLEEPAPRGTLPELHTEVEALGRSVDAARTALAGHTARVFDQHSLRDDVLGIPEGKCAYRSVVEYLRDRLRIPRRQAKGRIERSHHLMATPTLDHTETEPAGLPELARAAANAEMDPAALDVIVATLAGAREAAAEAPMAPGVVDALLAEGEQSLVASARDLDPDALGTVCTHWRLRFDAVVAPDGPEPAEARRAGQGLFYRGRRDGLHRWSLIAADGQHEVLKTITAAASNIRAVERRNQRTPQRQNECTEDMSNRPVAGSGPARGSGPAAGPIPAPDPGPASPVPPVRNSPPSDPDLAEPSDLASTSDEPEPETILADGEDPPPADADTLLADNRASDDADLEADRPGGFQEVHDLHTIETSIDPRLRWERQARSAQAAESEAAAERAASHAAATAGEAAGWNTDTKAPDNLDERSKGQRELDGLISALTGALALTSENRGTDGGRGTGGGARPHVLVTIDYQSLLEHSHRPGSEVPGSLRHRPQPCPEPCCESSLDTDAGVDEDTEAIRGVRISAGSYAGALNPTTIRAWACDAELIPVVLGGDGEVLDVGRSRRLFTPKLRRALIARDGGCAAPGCTIPAPWCEAHHIEHWEHGGPTSVDNGVLLCSHHHHVVHASGWTISMRRGVPWFIPAAYHDPLQRPRRNQAWRPRTDA